VVQVRLTVGGGVSHLPGGGGADVLIGDPANVIEEADDDRGDQLLELG
jgi:hypothetical protein